MLCTIFVVFEYDEPAVPAKRDKQGQGRRCCGVLVDGRQGSKKKEQGDEAGSDIRLWILVVYRYLPGPAPH